jgi:ERCC4-type nuclease
MNKDDLILEIDYRERDIIERLNLKDQSIQPFNFVICNLPIGDFILRQKDIIVYIIERKSITDLVASIKDSRFREQKDRLLDSMGGESDKIVYLLEGNKRSGLTERSKLSKNTLDSAIMNLIFKHKYKVLPSLDLDDTVEQLLLLYKKINTNDMTVILNKSSNLLLKKSEGKSSNVLVNQLCSIPGVSVNVAKKIIEEKKLENISDLINILKLNCNTLSEIKVSEKRKLGKVLEKKIYESLCGKINK